jgi:general secretion pathway protein G
MIQETDKQTESTLLRKIGKNRERGFTLIELMVVLVILGILAGLIIPRVMGRPDDARRQKTRVQMESIETALKLYKLDNGNYPTTEQGLQALVEAPKTGTLPRNWKEGGYLEKGKLPKDAWGRDYVYVSPGSHGDYDLSSLATDGEPGGEGKNKDITSWEDE